MFYRYFLWVVIIASLLLIGILCYLQGEKQVVAIEWLQHQLPSFYSWLMSGVNALPLIYRQGWIAHHLSDIMWSASFAMIICGIWVNQFSILKLLLVGIACAIFYEVLQLFGAAQGTFDIWDLMYSVCAGVLATLITYLLLHKTKYKVKEQFNENALNNHGR